MSVIVQTENGCILDHWKFSSLTVVSEKSPEHFQQYFLKHDLFEIIHPFRMDSQFKKFQTFSEGIEENEKIRKKRKRKVPMTSGEELAQEYHQEVKGYIEKACTELSSCGKEKGYLLTQCSVDDTDNNMVARQAALLGNSGINFIELCEQNNCQMKKMKIDKDSFSYQCVVNGIMEHDGSSSICVKYRGHQYIIPPHCSFLMSDVCNLNKYAKDLGGYDLIVMDPPWENKSVKRQKKYNTLDNEMILDIPLSELMRPGCLIVIWVTNKQKHDKFVMKELFPNHTIDFVARWYWLKVTRSGECVFDLNSPHKKPYETIIIGKLKQVDNHDKNDSAEECNNNEDLNCTNKDSNSCLDNPFDKAHYGSHNSDEDCDIEDLKDSNCATNSCHDNNIPDNQVIVSIPCSLHSKKPPLIDVLKKYLPESPRCLELFARNLQPYWTSWGNEVLCHQDLVFFEEVT